jgi:predicted house-cleaning noncanonical NTP pyrophosphatase (MazG superfamily)
MKLVRDKIPSIIEEHGKTYKYHTANYDEYKTRLYEKMTEELNEFINTPCYDEAADIYEVFSAICDLHELNLIRVATTAMYKRSTHGGFDDKIILEEVLDENRGSS